MAAIVTSAENRQFFHTNAINCSLIRHGKVVKETLFPCAIIELHFGIWPSRQETIYGFLTSDLWNTP